MNKKTLVAIKMVSICLSVIVMALSGIDFYKHRNYKEPVVVSEYVTQVRKLSDYFADLKDTINDCNIYIFEGSEPGGTVLLIGGTHPEEPGANLTAELIVENLRVKKGKVIIAIRANRSASTVTRPGDAYPQFYHIETPWGVKKFRMGDRWSNPLDSWPDPEVYVHYPSGQLLAYMDIRNFNRTWPGKKDGTITEKTNYAFMQLIEKEKVDLFIDLHEAELEYPVISTIVSHQRGVDIAAMTSMILSSTEFKIGMEYSPKELHGLSHREVGDHSRAISLLYESPEPFLDRVRGITDEKLLLTGKDPFVMKAGQFGLLYEKIDENGWPIDVRVGRHVSTFLTTLEMWNEFYPDLTIDVEGVPRYKEVITKGVGYYFRNPSEVPKNRVFDE
ncbi:MAG TPA: succinylglutamate desuccinylase [Pseudothermotoga sp.]|nr:succinylglutamate desuccinylase [Pseudothermotoga sp.]